MARRQRDNTKLEMSQQDEMYFDSIYAQHSNLFIYHALSYVRDTSTAEDVVADALIEFLPKCHEFRVRFNEKIAVAYIVGIIKNLAIKAYNKNKKVVRLDDLTLDEQELLKIIGADHTENRVMFYEVLREIPAKDRIVILMRLKHGFDFDQIAPYFGWTPDTVRSQVCRAKNKFKETWMKMYGEEDWGG